MNQNRHIRLKLCPTPEREQCGQRRSRNRCRRRGIDAFRDWDAIRFRNDRLFSHRPIRGTQATKADELTILAQRDPVGPHNRWQRGEQLATGIMRPLCQSPIKVLQGYGLHLDQYLFLPRSRFRKILIARDIPIVMQYSSFHTFFLSFSVKRRGLAVRSPLTIFVQYAVRRSSQCCSATLSEPEAGVACYSNRAAHGSAKGDSARDGFAGADLATDGFSGAP